MTREKHDIKTYLSTKMNSFETENLFTDCFFLLVIPSVENQQVKKKKTSLYKPYFKQKKTVFCSQQTFNK